ncbi:MAG: hypothetical protein ABIP54_02065 [Candidatus Andersenbacteria bacterium]
MIQKLRECPFCGYPGSIDKFVLYDENGDYEKFIMVNCGTNQGCLGGSANFPYGSQRKFKYKTQKSAIIAAMTAWNKRADDE